MSINFSGSQLTGGITILTSGGTSSAPEAPSTSPALTPTFGTPTSTADGFTVQVSNYDAAYTWAVSTTAGSATISNAGLVTVTGLTAEQSATVTVTTTRTGYASGTATSTGSAEAASSGPTKFMVGVPYRDDGSVSDAGSAYIYNMDGTGEVQLTASDSDTSAYFGYSVATYGTKVAAAAAGDNSQVGAVYVYNTDGTGEVKITAADGASGDGFGRSIAMSNTKIIVGATGDDDLGTQSGSVFIYDLDGTNEVQLTASDGATQSYFGQKVAICDTKVAVGAGYADSSKGAVYVYNLDGTSELKIVSSDIATGDQFGECIAMSDTKLVAGSPGDDSVGANNTGSVYVYNLDGTGEVKITGSDSAATDMFGVSVAMSDTKIVVGSMRHNSIAGAVYVYNTDGTGEVKITASDAASWDSFGASVAIMGDKIIVGASGKGSVYTFNLDGTGQQQFTDPDGLGEQFGRSVAFL